MEIRDERKSIEIYQLGHYILVTIEAKIMVYLVLPKNLVFIWIYSRQTNVTFPKIEVLATPENRHDTRTTFLS
jgi:hypothetical protein